MKLQTEGRQTERGTWLDHLGFEGPLQPGTHARSDPTGEFPTGPAVGEILPDIVAPDFRGQMVDVHETRRGGPLVMVFYRSAVW
jgi:hypothetical protein